MLSKICESPEKWDEVLHKVEFSLNNTIHRSIGDTPSKILFGINQEEDVDNDLKLFLENEINVDRDLANIRSNAVSNINKVQEQNKKTYKRKEPTIYKVNDCVVIKNYDIHSGYNRKLLPKYKGPYVIKKVLDNDRYIVGDMDGFQITQIPFETVCEPAQMKPWLAHQNYSMIN